jgi:hypothetical protein
MFLVVLCLGSALALVCAGIAIIRGRTAWRVVGGVVTILCAVPIGVYGLWLLYVVTAPA